VQQIVIDPEGEFATLRERFDYIVCAPTGADAVATPATAAALARALWKAGTSAIVDIYELKAHERTAFVRRFLEALVNAPRADWHPTLVVVDEIHVFAPQASQCESTSAVIDVATRGRKRGLALVGATQRLSKLHKDVAAELLNKLVGRTGLDVDVQRAADELGMTRAAATEALRNLQPGEFFAFGPALSTTVVRTTIGAVATTHPETGRRALVAPPPASSKVRAPRATLAGIPRAAAREAQTVDELRAELAKVRRALTLAEKAGSGDGVPEAEVQRRIDAALVARAAAAPSTRLPAKTLKAVAGAIAALQEVEMSSGDSATAAQPPRATHSSRATAAQPVRTAAPAPGPVADGMTGPEQRILDAVAWLESVGVDEPEQAAVAFLAGYSAGGGAYNNPRGRLNQRGLVEYRPGGRIRLTDAGRAAANRPAAPATNEELQARVLQRLGGPEQRLLRPLIDAYPASMPNTALAQAAGYTPGAGAFNNHRGRLRSLGLIDYPQPGHVVAKGLLFPKGRG
jgi:hypothetical protein